MNSKDVAFAIAENDKFFGMGITLEDLEILMEEAEKLFAFGRKDE